MRLISADRLLTDRMRSMYYHLPNGDTAVPIIDIERAPAVEILNDERIIRCKSCEHYADSMCSNLWMLHAVSPEDYCSRARLRT